MKNFLFLAVFFFFFNISKAQKLSNPPQEIASVYFQNWSGGQELTGSGTDFYIEFKKSLPNDIQLVNLSFRSRVVKLEKASETIYIARFIGRPEVSIDEMGNRTIVYKPEPLIKMKYKLADNEAMLEYIKAKRNRTFKFKNIEEKEMLAYPSAPPRNQGN